MNSNTGVTPTRDEVDNLLRTLNTLAIEVKGGTGDTSELNCGTLNYCSAGGSGTVNSLPFPGDPGSVNDSDSDGKGELTRGSTGDTQLQTGATLSEINSGDTFIQSVTSGTSATQIFFGRLNFVFKSTPAIKQLVFNPGTTVESVKTVTYPASNSMEGTVSNCFTFAATPGGDQILRVTAWGPQRAGKSVLGEADFVDIGGSQITIDLPNKPCTSGSCAGRSPNNCGVSTYSESDANLSTSTGILLDTRSDQDADPTNTVTFDVDLKACLAESGDTLDVGETMTVDVQFRSQSRSGGNDNAASKFCIRRTS